MLMCPLASLCLPEVATLLKNPWEKIAVEFQNASILLSAGRLQKEFMQTEVSIDVPRAMAS